MIVFPAYAGMFPFPGTPKRTSGRFPRVRGDVPSGWVWLWVLMAFSPRTRGCSIQVTRAQLTPRVFPAYAGMFLWDPQKMVVENGFPRVRGDVPLPFPKRWVINMFSPRTRGCSFAHQPASVSPSVFPAYAGMFRRLGGKRGIRRCFPRVRGDVPPRHLRLGVRIMFSPRTRGCSR